MTKRFPNIFLRNESFQRIATPTHSNLSIGLQATREVLSRKFVWMKAQNDKVLNADKLEN